MLKQQNTKIEDSNIANYGSDAHRDLRKDAAASEDEYKGAGSQVGVEVWRIENFGIKRWPEKQHGTFYQGDSFIVLHTYKEKADSKKLKYNVHFWLGADTTQDEYGTAAYKTVELDDLLDDVPVQYREVQGSESPQFRKVFPRMHILEGGVESAFNNVKPTEYKPRLLHVKGRNQVVVRQVPLKTKSLNDGDSFILDDGLTLYQWNGSTANHFEKRKAMETVNVIKEQRNGKPSSKVIDGLDDDADFWAFFGGKPDSIGAATPDKETYPVQRALVRLSNASGSMKTTVEDEGVLERNKLDSNDVFLVDIGHTLYAWVGKDASPDERKKAMSYGAKYLNEKDRPIATPIVRVVEGGETKAFNDIFVGPANDPAAVAALEAKHNSGKPLFEGAFKIKVWEGKELHNTQRIGKQDPFCRVRLGQQSWKTQTHEDGKDHAEWGNETKLALAGDESELIFIVMNDNILLNKEIGRVALPLSKLTLDQKESEQWYTIKDQEDQSSRGQIRVSIQYIRPAIIEVTGAKGLPDVQSLGKQDPMVRVQLGKQTYTTPAHENGGSEPKFDKDNEFKFNLVVFPDDEHLTVLVLNKNLVMNDTIAKGSISVSDLRKQVRGQSKWYPLQTKDGQDGAGEVCLVIRD